MCRTAKVMKTTMNTMTAKVLKKIMAMKRMQLNIKRNGKNGRLRVLNPTNTIIEMTKVAEITTTMMAPAISRCPIWENSLEMLVICSRRSAVMCQVFYFSAGKALAMMTTMTAEAQRHAPIYAEQNTKNPHNGMKRPICIWIEMTLSRKKLIDGMTVSSTDHQRKTSMRAQQRRRRQRLVKNLKVFSTG